MRDYLKCNNNFLIDLLLLPVLVLADKLQKLSNNQVAYHRFFCCVRSVVSLQLMGLKPACSLRSTEKASKPSLD